MICIPYTVIGTARYKGYRDRNLSVLVRRISTTTSYSSIAYNLFTPMSSSAFLE